MIHDWLIISMCVCVYININDDDESMLPPVGPEAEQAPVRLLDILLNRIMQKKQEMHKFQNRHDINRVMIEKETLQLVLA
jgi:hypothetical protein